MSALIVVVAMLSQNSDPLIDAAQLSRLLAASRSEIQDVSLVFEGYMAGGPEGTSLSKMAQNQEMIYQGNYALRLTTPEHFYAGMLDIYVEHREAKPTYEQRERSGVFQGRMYNRYARPDEGELHSSEIPGGPGSISRMSSPESILFWWYFSTYNDLTSRNYVCLGWEELDGHRCLRIQLDRSPEDKTHKYGHRVMRYWIDLTRGGHPLRVESHHNNGSDDMDYRVVDIKLAQLPQPNGRLVWFPVSGRVETLLTTAGYTKSPVGVETFSVVEGTVRFNQNLPDEVFNLKSRDKLPETEAIAKLRPRYEVPPPRNDPVGIKERLDRQLARADQQTKELDASAPAGNGWGWLPQAGLIALGVLALGGAAWKLARR